MASAQRQSRAELFLDVLAQFGEARLAVNGLSMLPAVWPGDILTIHRDGPEEIRAGDMVLSHRESQFAAHRVLGNLRRQGQTVLLTRGDRLLHPDPPVTPQELLGRVTAIERGGRRVSPRLSSWGRIASGVLRRSDLATRALLHLRNRF